MAFYTYMTGLGATALATTFTHSLGANYPGGGLLATQIVVRPIVHQVLLTVTGPIVVVTINTNIVTVAAAGVGLCTFDLECQVIFSENL